ncbi:hypothetical protein [Paracoccus denitrificans]|jgi:hypothetical protein|uniref:Cytochrome c family protein n=1 Tax=Paracoccus denitrificans (strain Pd 1222) TaxID=318586 RepID=A1BB08_PARDP|nr:hypothetical protein [Paracoccus denitrificans]ABL72702.1 conserved hypothetical protein [Paracoccus denitrificans PD1222]MBB4629279.1 hypothetical protein [Paracoccus denitrificans]MCU7430298.1 hypothetical protein [Paracoccus denitrificans]QAR29671.1 hypothetical protein EO213_25420 [Paracoccus denitrificans]UPV98555.1 hypothetical protein M0K93_23625 [Paracoccus denitrificans]
MRTGQILIALVAGVMLAFAASGGKAQTACSAMLITDPTSADFLTGDTPFGHTQDGMNCYGWQMFLSLNWPADPGWPQTPAMAGEPDRSATIADFGLPGPAGQPMQRPTVWQSFMPAPEIFKPFAAMPTGWGETSPPPASCGSASLAASAGSIRMLNAVSKSAVSPRHGFNLDTGTMSSISDEIEEATGGWLTDQKGKLVFFERMIGKAEYDYIVAKGLYDAANQLKVATNADGATPEGLSLPKGTPPGSAVQNQDELGAFELKAAWRNLTGLDDLYGRYLTSTVYLLYPDGSCEKAVVGLVGLHIIHKTASMPDFVWSTFEQIDNVPGASAPEVDFSFNNPASNAKPNQMPHCVNGVCDYSLPIQVTREVAIPAGVAQTNRDVQQLLADRTGGKSVFQYYQLVNVLWDGAPTPPSPEPGANAQVPLVYGTFQTDGSVPVANTTMETYAQQFTPGLGPSCTACHKGATIANSATLASDFSFLFSTASSATKLPGLFISRDFVP